MNHHIRSIITGTLTLIVLGILVIGVRFGMAFTGPTTPGGSGSGALGVDGGNNISVGTSTPISDTKLFVLASSTGNIGFAMKVFQPGSGPLFLIRNDRVIGIGQTIPAGVSTSTLIVGGNTLINGTLTATNIATTLNASNITAGVFGAGNFSFPSSLGIATTTQVSLPQELSIYGDAYLTGNIGLGVTSPGAKLHAIDSTAAITYPVVLESQYGTAADIVGAGVRFQRTSSKPWAEIVGQQLNPSDYNYGKLTFGTRTSDAQGVQTKMTILANGNVGIGITTPSSLLSVGATTTSLVAVFGGGTGKIDVGTVDPPYTINGKRYATYMPSMTGVKEETAGTVSCIATKSRCSYEIDFTKVSEGSDLWLFSKTTNLKNTFNTMTVLLSAGFEGKVWYEKDASAKKLTIYAERTTPGSAEISYRLTAPRFDADQWPNADENGSAGFIIED